MDADILELHTLGSFLELTRTCAPRLLVVDFFAHWCGPCKLIAPQFAALARKHKEIAQFVKVDVDAAPDVQAHARIRAMPTFHIYHRGERVHEMVGANLTKVTVAL